MRRNVLRLLAGVLLCLVLASLANAQPAGGGAGGGGAAGGGAAGGGAAGGGAAGGGAAGGGAGGAGAAAATAGPPSQVGRVIFRGTPEEIAAIERILAQHDRLPRQVLLEMYILDVNTRRSDNAGAALQTFFGTARPFGDMPLGAYQFDQRLGDANQSIRFGSLSTERFQLFLNFLKNMTDTRVLNRPSALVMDGGTATVNLGGQEGYVSGYETQSTANVGTSYIPQSSFLNTGQNLTLTPRIMPNDIILLNMTFDDTTRTGWTPVAGVTNGPPGYNLPITARRALVAPMFLKNGSAVIIGGLKSQKNDRSSTKIPILSQIPFIGRNFGRNLKESSTSELVLVLKATVYSQDDF